MASETGKDRKDTPVLPVSATLEEVEKMVVEQESVAKPKVRSRQSLKPVPLGQAPSRVVKVVRKEPFEDDQGVYQYGYSRADKSWDKARLNQDLEEFGFILAEQAGHPKFCEANDCWEVATDGNFCSKAHRVAILTAHDRLLRL